MYDFFPLFSEAFAEHCSNYMSQLFEREAVSQSWADVISPLTTRVVSSIKPYLARNNKDVMDIRRLISVIVFLNLSAFIMSQSL